MKDNMQKKIAQYKEEKKKKGILQNLIQEKRKNLQKMMTVEQPFKIEKEKDFHLQNYASEIDQKHNKYLEDMDELQNIKFKIIELRGALDSLQLQLHFQEDNLANWNKSYKKETSALEEMTEQLKVRLANDKSQKIKMEEQSCQRTFEHIEKLTNEKEQLIKRTEELLQKRKSLDLNLKKLKDNFQEDYKRQREVWAKHQQQRKQKWQAKKLQEITENTLRGLQPQIQRIVGSSKRQIQKIEQKYQMIRNDYKLQMNSQFEYNLKLIKKDISDKVEQEKVQLMEKSSEQYRKLTEKLVEFYEAQRLKLKAGKQAQIRSLQERRKAETDEFLSRNKEYLLTHLNEVKQIKSNYQLEIRQLDSSLDKLLEKEEKSIKEKYAKKMEQYRQEKRKELEQKVKAMHLKCRQQNEDNYEDLVEKIACENQAFESNIKKETESKVKVLRDQLENEVKKNRKELQSWMNRELQEKEKLKQVLEAKESIEEQYNQLQQQCEYLKKKEAEYQLEVVKLKAREGQLAESQQSDLRKISNHWQEQMVILRTKINSIQKQIQTQQQVLQQKSDQEKSKYTRLLNELDKSSLQVLKKINEQMDRARKEKEMKMLLNKKLQETKKKMRDLQAKRNNDFKL